MFNDRLDLGKIPVVASELPGFLVNRSNKPRDFGFIIDITIKKEKNYEKQI